MGNNWELRHVGVVVRDIDRTVEYYQSLGIVTGIGPDRTADNKSLSAMVYGEPADPKYKIKIKAIEIGPVRLQFNQPLEGESRQKDFLDNFGEGINHLAFVVDDLDSERAKLTEKGIQVMYEVKGNAYFDTREFGNVVIQLLQR